MKRQMALIIGTALTLVMAQPQAEDISAGEAIYTQSCAHCHGGSGQGMGSFPSIAGQDADYIAKRLTQYRAGEKVGPNTPLMAPMATDLSDDDIADLAAYISTTFE